MLKIITNPNLILRQKSLDVADVSAGKIQELIPAMLETMMEADGVGLAAPQVGQNVRLIVINHQDSPLAMINPKIIKKSLLKEWGEEGCLSVPGRFGEVKRFKKIKAEYLDSAGEKKQIDAQGLLARVIQHEVDHLDGILFIDKARKITEVTK